MKVALSRTRSQNNLSFFPRKYFAKYVCYKILYGCFIHCHETILILKELDRQLIQQVSFM